MNYGMTYGVNSGCKMVAANKAVVGLLKHLNHDDRIGIVTFENTAECIQKLELIQNINIQF